jgi:hypothetical protein
LLDGDIDPELADYLRAVGFDVQLAPRDNPQVIENDVEVLRYARRRRRIVVCHDRHRDRESELELFPEIYNNGGRILRIGGDSSQSLLLALGKVTVHYTSWSTWFSSNPKGGRVVLHKDKCIPTTAEDFMERHLHRIYVSHDIPPLPPKRRGRQARRHRPPPIAQRRLNL